MRWLANEITDVVVPIPLPLSAILILVIGKVDQAHPFIPYSLIILDLGFELFVALSFAWDKPETKDGLMRMTPRKPVNQRSITSLKKKALRRTKTLVRDPETNQVVLPSRFSLWKTKFTAPFTHEFWEDRLEQTDDESLVDNKLLSYAYLEAGMIEVLGA